MCSVFTFNEVLGVVSRRLVDMAFEPHIGNNFLEDHPTNSPASEFHATWSPLLSALAITKACSSSDWLATATDAPVLECNATGDGKVDLCPIVDATVDFKQPADYGGTLPHPC